MKICNKCLNQKPLMSFGKNKQSGDGLHWICKECRNAENKTWRISNPSYKRDPEKNKAYYKANAEKYKQYSKEWKKTNPEKFKEIHKRSILRTRYDITLEIYNEIFERQTGCCYFCKKHRSLLKRDLCVDHDHDTGKVRGLLCDLCNQLLGHYEKILKTGLIKEFDLYLNR